MVASTIYKNLTQEERDSIEQKWGEEKISNLKYAGNLVISKNVARISLGSVSESTFLTSFQFPCLSVLCSIKYSS